MRVVDALICRRCFRRAAASGGGHSAGTSADHRAEHRRGQRLCHLDRASEMRPDLLIVARAASEQAVPKLLQAGADRVVNPQKLGGIRMAALAIQPHVAEFLDVVMHDGSLEFRLAEIQVLPHSELVGKRCAARGCTIAPARSCWPCASPMAASVPIRRPPRPSPAARCSSSSATTIKSPRYGRLPRHPHPQHQAPARVAVIQPLARRPIARSTFPSGAPGGAPRMRGRVRANRHERAPASLPAQHRCPSPLATAGRASGLQRRSGGSSPAGGSWRTPPRRRNAHPWLRRSSAFGREAIAWQVRLSRGPAHQTSRLGRRFAAAVDQATLARPLPPLVDGSVRPELAAGVRLLR